jgi:hypothetical protein
LVAKGPGVTCGSTSEPHRKKRKSDPGCIGCHVTGIGDEHKRMREHSADDLDGEDRDGDPEHDGQPTTLLACSGPRPVIVRH